MDEATKAEIAKYKIDLSSIGAFCSNPAGANIHNPASPSTGIIIQRGIRVALPNDLPDTIKECFVFEDGFLNMTTYAIANHIGIKINQTYRELSTLRVNKALVISDESLFYDIHDGSHFATVELFDTVLCYHKLCGQYTTINQINMPIFLCELQNSFRHLWHRFACRTNLIDYKRFMAYCKVEKEGIYRMNTDVDASEYLHSYFNVLKAEVESGTLLESTAKNHFKLTNTIIGTIAQTQGFNIDVIAVKKQTGLLECFDVHFRDNARERGHMTGVNRATDATLEPGDVKRFTNAIFDCDILASAKSRDLAKRNHDVMQLQLWVALEFGSGCRGFQLELVRLSSVYVHALTPPTRENEIASNCSCLCFDTAINKTNGSGGSQHALVDHYDIHLDSCFLLSLALHLQCAPYDSRPSILNIIGDEMEHFMRSNFDENMYQFKWWKYHIFGQLNAPEQVCDNNIIPEPTHTK